jgi:hypothetical protein
MNFVLQCYTVHVDVHRPTQSCVQTSEHIEEEIKTNHCGLVVRDPGSRTEMYCVPCGVRTEFIYAMQKKVDRLCGLVVRVPGYRTEIYCVSCEVRTECIYIM